jgi:hypothetical protein
MQIPHEHHVHLHFERAGREREQLKQLVQLLPLRWVAEPRRCRVGSARRFGARHMTLVLSNLPLPDCLRS